MKFRVLLAAALAVCGFQVQSAVAATTPQIKSATKLAFGDAGTLFVADWMGGRIYQLPVPVPAAEGKPFNLKDIQGTVATALHAQPTSLRFEDLVVQPGSEIAYVALTIKHGASSKPAVVAIDAAGKVRTVDLKKTASSVAITDEPSADMTFWHDMPGQSLTVTDMRFYQGRLYVAGLSDRSFASTLRIYDYPFQQAAHVSTIEMYHPVHNQIETRAPIREMAITTLNGEPTLVAAYTCTPLVTIPLKDLTDGAHVTAKTIGEMGWGSQPVGMVTFKTGDADYLLMVNSSRSADLLPLSDIADSTRKPGLNTPIEWPAKPYLGVKATMVPLSAAMRIDNLNDGLLLALRRDDSSGAVKLESIPKGAYLRLSDFVNEYDFKDYQYPAGDKFHDFHKFARGIEGYTDLVR